MNRDRRYLSVVTLGRRFEKTYGVDKEKTTAFR